MDTGKRTLAVVVLLAALATACSTTADEPPPSSDAASTTATSTTTTAGPAATTPAATQAPATTSPAPAAPSADDITIPAELRITPRQSEGPYYPVTKPDDRDGNLLVLGGGEATTMGTPLEISGLLLYEDGAAIAGATIEIWQVDGQGIYDHPRAPNTESRDPAFQFYGESVTDSEGFWTFLTLEPVVYESRPRHIHVKVKIDGDEVLTTQIYFDGDPLINSDGIAAAAGDDLVLLTAVAVPGTLSTGGPGLVARHLIVLAR